MLKVEINPRERQLLAYAAVEVENIWLKSSTLAVSKSVLRLFASPIGFCLHTKKWPRVARFWKIWLSQ